MTTLQCEISSFISTHTTRTRGEDITPTDTQYRELHAAQHILFFWLILVFTLFCWTFKDEVPLIPGSDGAKAPRVGLDGARLAASRYANGFLALFLYVWVGRCWI